MIKNNQKGVSLIITFFILTIILSVTLSISIILYKEIKVIRNMGNSVVAFYAADSGVEKILYYDRKEKPVGARNGICSVCDSENCDPPPAGDDCDPSSCGNCDISFYTNLGSDKNYYITVNVSTDGEISNLSIDSIGDFKDTKRAIQVSYSSFMEGGVGLPLQGWSHRKKITIDHAYVDSDLTDFPLYVYLDPNGAGAGLAASVKDNGYDIRFTSSDGVTLLKYEREAYSEALDNSTGHFWVKAPIIAGASNTDIYMYYGKTDATDGQDPANVWDSNFISVYHMNELSWSGSSNEVRDSKNSYNGGALGGADTTANGRIYRGGNFDKNGYVEVSPFSMPVNKTFSLWVYPRPLANNKEHTLIEGGNDNPWFGISVANNIGKVMLWRDNPIAADSVTSAWQYATYTSDQTSDISKIYINGLQSGSDGTAYTSSSAENIGIAFNTGDTKYDGYMDEIRISNSARSAEWVKFEYHNMAEPDNELIWGNEE